jgi:hypothetical protein
MDDAQELIDFLKVVGSETDFLLADENGSKVSRSKARRTGLRPR